MGRLPPNLLRNMKRIRGATVRPIGQLPEIFGMRTPSTILITWLTDSLHLQTLVA